MSTAATAEPQLSEQDAALKSIAGHGMQNLTELQQKAANRLLCAEGGAPEITLNVPLDSDTRALFSTGDMASQMLAVLVQLLRVMTPEPETE